jgi:hypothetical protein
VGSRCLVAACWLALAPALAPAPARAGSVLDELKEKEQPQAARLNFSGSTDFRYVDGGRTPTPANVNNQITVGGVSTFTALRLHLFLDATLSKRSTLFVKIGGGSPDLARVVLDAMAVTTSLGDGWPSLVAGRYLNNFGRFPQRFLGPDNPLIGEPLLYTYATSLAATQVPASAADLVRQRGRGLATRFAGYPGAVRGQQIVSNVWYLNGLKLDGVHKRLAYSAGLSNEVVSTANFFDINDDKTVTVHVGYKPDISLGVGASYSNGAYLEQAVFANPATLRLKLSRFRQRTFGVDVDYAKGHFSFFGEYIHNSWDTPNVADGLDSNGFFVEPRYKLMPGLAVVARWEQIHFNDIAGPIGPTPWENDVQRVELGLSYAIERDLLAKVSHQWNRTGGPIPPDPSDDVAAAQLVAVF